jgi:hypothetical protein
VGEAGYRRGIACGCGLGAAKGSGTLARVSVCLDGHIAVLPWHARCRASRHCLTSNLACVHFVTRRAGMSIANAEQPIRGAMVFHQLGGRPPWDWALMGRTRTSLNQTVPRLGAPLRLMLEKQLPVRRVVGHHGAAQSHGIRPCLCSAFIQPASSGLPAWPPPCSAAAACCPNGRPRPQRATAGACEARHCFLTSAASAPPSRPRQLLQPPARQCPPPLSAGPTLATTPPPAYRH